MKAFKLSCKHVITNHRDRVDTPLQGTEFYFIVLLTLALF